MTVSTSSKAWNSGYLVMAYGTMSEVLTEMAAGAVSQCPLENFEDLKGITSASSSPSFTATWYTRKSLW